MNYEEIRDRDRVCILNFFDTLAILELYVDCEGTEERLDKIAGWHL